MNAIPVAFPLSSATNTTPFDPAFNVLIVNPPMRDVVTMNYPSHPNAVRFISNAIVRALDKAGHITVASQTGGEASIRSNGPPTELKRIILDAVTKNYGGDWKFEGDAKLVAPTDVLDREEQFYRDETSEPAHAYEQNPSDWGGVHTAFNPPSVIEIDLNSISSEKANRLLSYLRNNDIRYYNQNPTVADLSVEMAVYVPSTTDADVPLPTDEVNRRVAETQTFLASLFGGHTTVAGKGGYVSDVKGLIAETVVKVTAFASEEDWAKHRPSVEKWLSDKAKEWGQETIGFELEGDLKLVNPAFRLPKPESTVETVLQGQLATALSMTPAELGEAVGTIPHPRHRHELVKVGETNPDRRPVYRCELCKKYYSEAK
jgi:hypothetical protein